jgi:uncharacterized membrane protein
LPEVTTVTAALAPLSRATSLAFGGGKHGPAVTIVLIVVLVAVIGGVVYSVARSRDK